jgi:hypothetical protein
MSTSSWPSTPLDAAERAFVLLAEAPTHVPFDARGFGGLPDRIVSLDEVRRPVLTAGTSAQVRDAVWRELVVRARRDGSAWRVAAVGMAMPGLRRQAGLLARRLGRRHARPWIRNCWSGSWSASRGST